MSNSDAVMELIRQKDLPGVTSWARARLNRAIRRQRLKEARARGTHTALEWMTLCARFDNRCVRCESLCPSGLQKDHIVPIYQGGSDGIDNLQPLCGFCNASKGPETTNWVACREVLGFTDEQAGAA